MPFALLGTRTGQAVALVVVLGLAVLLYGNWRVSVDDAKEEAEAAKAAIETHERINDADVSAGNPDADFEWLCRRAGLRDGCP